MTRKNIIGQYVYTAREYVAEFPQMRGGDIFMGAFNAEQVMYNHFGYRTPVGRLYMAGSAAHPGGAISGGSGYISAGIIARDLGLMKLWWKPWDAGEALTAIYECRSGWLFIGACCVSAKTKRPGLLPAFLEALEGRPFSRDQARSKRSAFITLVHAATKSFTNFSFASAHA